MIVASLICQSFLCAPAQAVEIGVGTVAGTQDVFGSDPAGNGQIVGKTAPKWSVHGWVNGENVELTQFRGKVVLLRFLNDSPSGTAALLELQRTYGQRGMAVVGLYVPTPFPMEISLDTVKDLAGSYGLGFPVGLDSQWETLNRYWLDRPDADVSSSLFLIDQQGIVRYIQTDGLYDNRSSKGNLRREYMKLVKVIEDLLKSNEKSESGTKQ